MIVAALVVLAFLLRAPNIGRAYWVDEGITIGIASHPLRQIPRLLKMDGSPPLFYGLLHLWVSVFGTSEVATHLLPLLISLVTIPVGYWAGRDLFGRRAGLASAALFATNPYLSWFSTETRMYTLIVLLATVALTFSVRAVRQRRPGDMVAAILAFTSLLYTHNWCVYLFGITAIVIAALALARRDRTLVCQVCVAAGAVVVLWLPWIPTLMEQTRNTAAPWAVRPLWTDFFADISTSLGGTAGVLVVPLLVAGVWWTRRTRPPEHVRLAAVLAAIGLLTGLAGWAGAQFQPSWTVRYLGVIVAPLLLAAAGALAESVRGRGIIAGTCTLLVVWSVIGSLLPNSNARYAKSNAAAVSKAASPSLAPGDVVVVTQTEQLSVLAHYLPGGLQYVTPTGPVTDPYSVDWRDIVHRLQLARPCAAIDPTIAALPIGAAVLEITPRRQLGSNGSAWHLAVAAQVNATDAYLTTDPGLQAVALYQEGISPAPYSPVQGTLFRKVAQVDPCGRGQQAR